MTGRSNLIDVEGCTYLRSTDLAVHVEHGNGRCWLPKSQCQLDPEDPEPGDTVTVTLAEPLATEKEMI